MGRKCLAEVLRFLAVENNRAIFHEVHHGSLTVDDLTDALESEDRSTVEKAIMRAQELGLVRVDEATGKWTLTNRVSVSKMSSAYTLSIVLADNTTIQLRTDLKHGR